LVRRDAMKGMDLEGFPASPCGADMLESVDSGGFYEGSYVGKWLFQVMGMEYDDALGLVEELPWQMFPETATWGLKYHEMKWGLPVRASLSYEERRKYIYQKRDERYPMTPYWLEEYLGRMTGLDIQVEDCNDPGIHGYEAGHPNRFSVVVVSKGTLPGDRIALMKGLLDKVKQSHTSYGVVYENMLAAQSYFGAVWQDDEIFTLRQVDI